VIPRGKDKWLVRVFVGRENGKRKYHSEMVSGKFSQADQKLTKLLSSMDQGSFVPKSGLTVGDLLYTWLAQKLSLKVKTRLDYDHRIKKDILPFPIAQVRLDAVTKLHISKLIGSLVSDRQLSPRTIRYTISILSQAFSAAIDWGLLYRNPCVGVELPRKTAQEMKWMTPAQTNQFLDHHTGHPWIALWRLLLTTGMRPQEALALKWEDLGDGKRLMIRRAIEERAKGERVVVDELKTDASKRNITLSSETLAALEAHRKRQLVEIIRRGEKYDRQGFIFATSTGTFPDIANVRKWWYKALEDAKLPKVRLYDTRHTHITQLLSLGVNVKAVASRSGHSNPVVLLNTYAHVLPEVEEQAASDLEVYLTAARQKAKEA
jgi:integrase